MTQDRTNEVWLRDLRSEDTDALQALRAHLNRGLGYALSRYHVTEVDVEDFVQDALVKILASLDTFRGESRFTTWASKIATRVALSELRRRRWKDVSLQDIVGDHDLADFTPMILSANTPSPEKQSLQRDLSITMSRAFSEALTERQRTAMSAAMFGGMPLDEIAKHMGSNRNALYKLIHDGRLRLKAYLLDQGLTYEDFLSAFTAS